ncbi:DUF92 domain-containing protein [Prochlorococcus sp. MIT 1307]|uniref:DUF92 domain-containing protein n=1 Tax=Prochlorococcus sp. MIT 1307 TaxID=3096219 RepID=UPI002A75AC38|nr:DUF92 domain-containing protein [Prochlorococcus sp. MIT 1307]
MISLIPIESVWLWAFCLNALLIAFAQRVPLLTRSGWVHAGALGTILWGCLGWRGWLSVVLYLCFGSLVTRLGFARKKKAGLAEGRDGCRGPENLWGSAATGACLALLIGAEFGSQKLLLIGFAASFAAKLADTFGSEIGKRWGTKTVLITSLKQVPVGTDGAISIEGTFASVLGSFLMTFSIVSLFFVEIGSFGVLIFVMGFVATLFESFLGAVVQQRLVGLTNEMINFLQTCFAALTAMTIAYWWG